MYLSLPIQSTSSRTMTATVFTCDGTALPSPITVTVSKQGRCRDLIQALSNACSLKPNERLLLVEVCTILEQKLKICLDWNSSVYFILIGRVISFCYSQIRNHLIHRFFEDPLQLLSSIKDDDRLAVYKIPKMEKNTKYLQLIHRRREQYVISIDLYLN